MNDRRLLDRVFLFVGVSACCMPAVFAGGSDVVLSASNADLEAPAPKDTSSDSFDGRFLRRMFPADSTPAESLAPARDESAAVEPQPSHAAALADPLMSEMLRTNPSLAANFSGSSSEDDSTHHDDVPQHPLLTDTFFFGFGGFLASSTTEARLDSAAGVGTNVGFENLLGLDNSKAVPQGLARWRMSDRWRLEVEYFSLNRSGSKQLGQDVNWGDETFLNGTVVNSKFDVSVYRVSAGYSFFKTADKEFGVALGFHITDVDVSVSSGGSNEDSGKLLAPLPVISMYGLVALTDKVALSGRLDAFRLAYSPYEGHIYSIGLDVLYQAWRHVGFGIGWRSLEMEFSASNHDWEGSVRSIFQGPIAFVSASF